VFPLADEKAWDSFLACCSSHYSIMFLGLLMKKAVEELPFFLVLPIPYVLGRI